MILSKARLAIALSQLKVFDQPNAAEEQYAMDSEIGAEVLWNASMNDDIEGKQVADLGCGPGMLGIGALLLGAAKVFFVEADAAVIPVLEDNLKQVDRTAAVVHHAEVQQFQTPVDTVIQNPPFGTRQVHADRAFLERAFSIAPVVYSFHKATSEDFLQKFSADQGFTIAGKWHFDFPIKMSQLFHRRAIHRVKVGCWKFVRQSTSEHVG